MATTKTKRERRASAVQYCSNADLLTAWYEAKELGLCTNKLAKFIMLLAERYSYHPSFANYSFREDMVSLAVSNLAANWHKFDPSYALDKGHTPNIFAYYTTCCYRSFLYYLHAEKQQRDIRDEMLLDQGLSPSWNYKPSDNFYGGAHLDSDTQAFGAYFEA